MLRSGAMAAQRSAAPATHPAIAAAVLLALAGCAGCAEREDRAVVSGRNYRLRGVVVALPGAGDASLTLSHEALPDFVDSRGELVGMDAMTMPFPLGRDVALEGVEVGDQVECTLHVDWEAERPVEVTVVRELPAGSGAG